MEHNQFDEHSPTDKNALWMYELSVLGSMLRIGSGFSYQKVELLMKHFGVSNPEFLVGKVFDSPRESATSALDLLLTEIENSGKYTPPSSEEIRHIAAVALSKLEMPDYKGIDKETISRAFQEIWSGFRAKSEWLKSFAKEIKDLSDPKHKVRLLQATRDDVFKYKIRGPAEYMLLKCGRKTQRVIIGPYSNPISFD
jgi:hypothetical protein